MATHYQQQIAQIVGPGVDPRHVEAYMRLEYSTLDQFPPNRFAREAYATLPIIGMDVAQAERLAQSYGL